DRIVSELAPRRGRDVPLFNVIVALQNIAIPGVTAIGLSVSDFPLGAVFAEHDLAFEFAEHDDELVLTITYRAARFSESTIARLAQHYERVLEGIVADPGVAIGALPLVGERELAELAAFNATARAFPRDATIAGMFAEQVRARPGAAAVTWWDGELSYAELEARSNRLAHHLREWLGDGGGGQPLIGVLLERSPELVVALLGIVK